MVRSQGQEIDFTSTLRKKECSVSLKASYYFLFIFWVMPKHNPTPGLDSALCGSYITGFVTCPFLLRPPLSRANGVRNEMWLVDRLSCPCFTSVISATLKLCHGLQGFVVNHYLPLSDCSLLHTVDALLSAASWVTNISC